MGRRSAMLLMAYMHNAEFFTPKMTRNYDVKAFRNDLKEVWGGRARGRERLGGALGEGWKGEEERVQCNLLFSAGVQACRCGGSTHAPLPAPPLQVLKRAGVEGRPMLLFLEDYQLLDPAFLEYVNSLLSGGEGGGGGCEWCGWSKGGDPAFLEYVNSPLLEGEEARGSGGRWTEGAHCV